MNKNKNKTERLLWNNCTNECFAYINNAFGIRRHFFLVQLDDFSV